MNKASLLRHELNTWKAAWQQVETFLGRIDTARDQDGPQQRRCAGLLRAARAIEHQRLLFRQTRALSDPVIDRLPDRWYAPARGEVIMAENSSLAATAWQPALRQWRIPGSDELEIAAGNLLTTEEGVLEQVMLKADLDLGFAMRFKQEQPLSPVRLPAYPGALQGHSIVPRDGNVDISGTVGSLFSLEDRKKATLHENGASEPVRAWSSLCAHRRSRLDTAAENEILSSGPSLWLSWNTALAEQAREVIRRIFRNKPAAAGKKTAPQLLHAIGRAAAATARWIDGDRKDLAAGLQVLEKEGASQDGVAELLQAAVARLSGQRTAFLHIVRAVFSLRGLIDGPDLGRSRDTAVRSRQLLQAEKLGRALDELEESAASHELFDQPVEQGMLAAELDHAFRARLRYPDGSLRMVRTLEWMFLAAWPSTGRWFRTRCRDTLEPLFREFRRPFIQGLQALVRGGYTGLPCEGLRLDANSPGPVGCDSLLTDLPDSMLGTLERIETGHIGIIAGERAAAVVILGTGTRLGKVELHISPLRVSVSSQPPGSAGLIAGGGILSGQARGLTADELRRGEAATGPADDGLIQETVTLWSRLALVFGRQQIEAELRNDGPGGSDHNAPFIDEPSARPLSFLTLHGQVPRNCLSLAIIGVPAPYWETVDHELQPRIARPGEILLLRGRIRAESQEEETPWLQTAVEVHSVYRTTAAVLARMDRDSVARLSTSPVTETQEENCICGPEEPVVMITLRRTWLRDKDLTDDISLRRDFSGFDLPSLATETLLPEGFVNSVVQASLGADDQGMDRYGEFQAAREVLTAWTRYTEIR